MAVAIALFLRTFFVQAYKIPSASMFPTLCVGDHLFAIKFLYGVKLPFTKKKVFWLKRPERRQIIVFRYPGGKKDFIKRVIALPGESVRIEGDKVYVDGEYLKEPYAFYSYRKRRDRKESAQKKEFVLQEGEYFVMGDNRYNSFDSRFWGPLDENLIKGFAFIRYWPPHRWGLIR